MEILKNGILKIKFELLEFWNFWKILRMVVLENYSKNGNLKIKFKNLNFGKSFENIILEN